MFFIGEIFFSLWVVDEIGFFESLYWLVLAFFLGLFVLRFTGFSIVQDLQKEMQQGKGANGALIRNAMRFLAGILLMFPGMLSDFFAAAFLLFSFTPFLDRLMGAWLRKSFKSRVVFTSSQQGPFKSYSSQTYTSYETEDFGPRPMRDVTPSKPDELPESKKKTDS